MASTTVEIAPPPDEVFAFVTDPTSLSAWQDAVEVQQLTEGPVRAGTRFREVQKAMGRQRVELTEVVECDPGRLFHIRVVEGPPVDGRREFAPTPAGGTRLTLTPLAHLSGRARIANRAMEQMTALAFRRFHRRLKRAIALARTRSFEPDRIGGAVDDCVRVGSGWRTDPRRKPPRHRDVVRGIGCVRPRPSRF